MKPLKFKPEMIVQIDECVKISEDIHYPGHWDTAAYPTLGHALIEVVHGFECECNDQDDD